MNMYNHARYLIGINMACNAQPQSFSGTHPCGPSCTYCTLSPILCASRPSLGNGRGVLRRMMVTSAMHYANNWLCCDSR